ncbi:MAG: hypothetical protein ACI9NC_002293, partial [Verrucomicrobiales bacterium]
MMDLLAVEGGSGFYFRYGPVAIALGVLMPLAILYAIFLYRRHPELSLKHRVILGVLRALVYAAIILLLLAPVVSVTKKISLPNNILVLLDVSESMSIPDRRSDPGELADAAAALGKIPLMEIADGETPELPVGTQSEVEQVSRLDLAKGVLGLPELEMLRSSSKSNKLASYSFGEKLIPSNGDTTGGNSWFDTAEATAKSSRLGDALSDAIDRHGGQSITGVVVLSDGASNEGIEVVETARQLGDRSIPVHTIGLGLTEPDDVRIKAVLVADTVFYKDSVPVRVLLESHGFQGRVVELELTVNGTPVANNKLVLRGEQSVEELSFVPDQQSGQAQLVVTASVLPGDVAPENNRYERSISIIDDKINVLYVEAEPRWEYRYLRAVLLRDHRLEVKFLQTEGDPELARASEQYLEEFPDEPAETFKYDLIIVGDVPAEYFTATQLANIEELVSKRGGSFLMLAGRKHAPSSYRDSPIAKLLPVKIGSGGHDRISPSLYPMPTERGMRS